MSWLGRVFRKRKFEAQLDSELQFHIEQKTTDLISSGVEPAEARRRAMAKLGGIEAIKQEYRESRATYFLESFFADIRYALRTLRKSPEFTAVAVVTLALGIGANTAIFSLIDAVMLRPLPVRDPQHLYLFSWRARASPEGVYNHFGGCAYDRPASKPATGCSFPLLTVNAFRAETSVFSGIAVFSAARLQAAVNGRVVAHGATVVSGDYFSTLGVKAALGRTIEPSDERPGAAPVVVLSYAFWRRAFGGKRSVIGRTIFLDRLASTVVGVVEPSFTYLSPGMTQNLYFPIALMPQVYGASETGGIYDGVWDWWLAALGRLKPGVSPKQAGAAVSVIFGNELRQSGRLQARMTNPGILLTPAAEGLTGRRRRYSQELYIFMFAAGMILLIACANVAGLLVARGEARQKEIALRLAIGAGRGQIVRQLLTESFLLSGAGGVVGVGLAYGIVKVVRPLVSFGSDGRFPFVVAPDWRVLCFALSVTTLSGIFFGLAPALAGTRLDLTPALKENVPTHVGGASRFGWLSLGRGLVVAQVALGAVVLSGAGLLVHTLENLRAIDPGFDPRNILLVSVDATRLHYAPAQLESLYEQLRERLGSLPGVRSASYSYVPLVDGDLNETSAEIQGGPKGPEVRVDELGIGPDFLRTMRIPLLAGRGFSSEDFQLVLGKSGAYNAASRALRQLAFRGAPFGPAASSERARIRALNRTRVPVLVNEAFVRQYTAGMHTLGAPILLGCCVGSARIVGVVGDTKYSNLRGSFRPTVYFPMTEERASFELRTPRDPAALAPTAREIVRRIDPNLPLISIRTETQAIDGTLWQERMYARLSTYFAALAALLASIGLYGLLAYEVARRRREIGIRVALGAQRCDVLRQVIGEGIVLAGVGAAAGIAASLAVTRFLGSLLYGVRRTDPITFAGVVLLLGLVAVAACYIPALRAARVDPVEALRYE